MQVAAEVPEADRIAAVRIETTRRISALGRQGRPREATLQLAEMARLGAKRNLSTVSPLLFANLDMMGRQGGLGRQRCSWQSMGRHMLFVRLAFATFRQESTARQVAHPVAIIRSPDICAWSSKMRPAIRFVPLLWHANVWVQLDAMAVPAPIDTRLPFLHFSISPHWKSCLAV